MRKRFEAQLPLGKTPIEKVSIPAKSRDALAKIFGQLQWLFQTPNFKARVFSLLEEKLPFARQSRGRPGLDLWHILVLGIVKLCLDCNYDRLEHLANYDALLRQILGRSPLLGPGEKPFVSKTLANNISRVDDEFLEKINQVMVEAGRTPFKRKLPAARKRKKRERQS